MLSLLFYERKRRKVYTNALNQSWVLYFVHKNARSMYYTSYRTSSLRDDGAWGENTCVLCTFVLTCILTGWYSVLFYEIFYVVFPFFLPSLKLVRRYVFVCLLFFVERDFYEILINTHQ